MMIAYTGAENNEQFGSIFVYIFRPRMSGDREREQKSLNNDDENKLSFHFNEN
jgi:hypothetical protein